MKFKLDENLDARFASILVDTGHECDSVRAEGLGGKSDDELFTICAADGRVLVTLDLASPIQSGSRPERPRELSCYARTVIRSR